MHPNPAPTPQQPTGGGAGAPPPPQQMPAGTRQFEGQQPGEHVLFAGRPHPLYLVVGSWKLLLFIFVLFALYLFVRLLVAVSAPLPFIIVGVFVLFSLHFIRWMAEDLNFWLTRKYIVTDWRLIDSWGFYSQHREQAPLDRIQHVQLERHNLIATWLDIGNVRVLTASAEGDLLLAGVRHPHEWVRQLYSAQSAHGPVGPRPVELRHPAMQAAWKKLENHDERPRTTSPLGRLARPGGPPHVHLSVPMLPNEEVLERFLRHPIALLRRLGKPLLIAVVGALIAFLYAASGNPNVGLFPAAVLFAALLIALLWGVIIYLDYADDYLVLTTHRVIQIERRFFLFAEARNEAMYGKIQDVNVAISLWGEMFGYGTVTVQTAGRIPDIVMDHVPHPLDVQNRILACVTAAKERSEMGQRKRRYRNEFRRWMANTLNELLIVVPEVRGLTMLDAAEELRRLGLRMVVVTERAAPGLPPGVVLEQAPLNGTSAIRGNEVRVILSRRAAAAVAP